MCFGIRGVCAGVSILPILVGMIMTLAVTVTYLIAVIKKDESAFFPYISDAGVEIPERNIFSQLFNMAASLAFITMYLRYKLVGGITGNVNLKISRLNKFNGVLSFFVCFGLSLVANFQESKQIEFMHVTGALMVFGLGTLYAIVDVVVSYLMHPLYNGIYICRVRLAVALFGLISLITAITSGGLSRRQWEDAGYDPKTHDRPHWTPDESGYTAHIVSTFAEWSMALSFLLYFLTFVKDFRKFTIQINTNMAVAHLDQEPFFDDEENRPLL